MMPAMLNTDAKAILLCAAVFAVGAALFALGVIIDPTGWLHHKFLARR